MGRKKLLDKDEVLRAINQWRIQNGLSPTMEELRKVLGVGSTRTVFRYLKWLEEEGDLERWQGARGLRPRRAPGKGLETREIPIVGEAPAGPFMLAEQDFQGWVRLPKDLVRPASARFFLLRVRGDSMNRARVAGLRIEDGDLVLVRQQPTAEPGDVVVALVDGEATVKRLERGPGYYVLKPESKNPAHRPILATQDFAIVGMVCRVLKKGSAFLT